MAKFLISSSSHFTPFNYDQLVKPLQQMTEAQNATADAYDTLNLETEALGRYISENPNDSEAKRLYDGYLNNLHNLQNELWENGYSAKARRGLTTARAGYANDILRIKNAIESRQARSKEYWDAVHKNPDLIVGFDPGASGLNDYMKDANYGTNWFSYSGDDFVKSVASDAKARAAELIARNPQRRSVPGAIQEIVDKGFTNAEVDAAVNAVRNNTAHLLKDDDKVKILADVLRSHIEATGAQSGVNLSPEQYNRFLDYGRTGLSYAVMEPSVKDYSDPEAEFQQWKRKFDYQRAHTSVSGGKDGKNPIAPGVPYHLNTSGNYMESANGPKYTGARNEYFIKPFNNVIMTKNNGEIRNYKDAENILNSLGLKQLEDSGFDIEKFESLPEEMGSYKFTKNGREYRVMKGRGNHPIVQSKFNGKDWFTLDSESKKLDDYYFNFRQNLNVFEDENGIDLRKLAIPKKEREKLYKMTGASSDVPFELMPYILDTMSMSADVTPAYLADPKMKSILEDYGKIVSNNYSKAVKDKKGVLPKTSDAVVYETRGYDILRDMPLRDLKQIFGMHREGNQDVLNDNAMTDITLLPEDFVRNDNGTVSSMVRFTTNNGAYAAQPTLFGNDMKSLTDRIGDDVATAMMPIMEPSKAVVMNPFQIQAWRKQVTNFLGDGLSEYLDIDRSTPANFVTNPQLQQALRNAVIYQMNVELARTRENMAYHNMQTPNEHSNNATGYTDYFGYETVNE